LTERHRREGTKVAHLLTWSSSCGG